MGWQKFMLSKVAAPEEKPNHALHRMAAKCRRTSIAARLVDGHR